MLKSLFVAVLLSVAPAGAGDWPQWRGPNRDAASGATAARGRGRRELIQRWRADVGAGQSSPVVSGTTVFLFSREGERETARALDLRTGHDPLAAGIPGSLQRLPGRGLVRERTEVHAVLHDGRLFTLGISGILTAFDAKDGRIAWQKDFAGRFQASAPPFGTSMSPLVAGGLLIVHAGGHEGGALIAFDPATGARSGRWKATARATPPPSSRPSRARSSS